MNLIKPSDLQISEIILLLEEACYPEIHRFPQEEEWLGMAFFENSTRTKLSFQKAAVDNGFRIFDLPTMSSLEKGETEMDTVRNMIEIGQLRTMIVRSRHAQLITDLAREYPEVRFINAGNGTGHHPTQALGDLLTLARHFGGWDKLKGKTITIVGDVVSSRVANSNRDLLTMFGMQVRYATPNKRTLTNWEDHHRCGTLEEALESDVVMALRIQHERKRKRGIGYPRQQMIQDHLEWQITTTHLEGRPDLRIMHPGPVNRGVELTDDVVDGMQSLILNQAVSGYEMRRALLHAIRSPENS